MACYHHKHIHLGGFFNLFTPSWQQYIKVFAYLCTACFTAYLNFLFIIEIWGERGFWYSQARRSAIPIPEWFIALSGVWSFSVMTLRFLLDAWQQLQQTTLFLPNTQAKEDQA